MAAALTRWKLSRIPQILRYLRPDQSVAIICSRHGQSRSNCVAHIDEISHFSLIRNGTKTVFCRNISRTSSSRLSTPLSLLCHKHSLLNPSIHIRRDTVTNFSTCSVLSKPPDGLSEGRKDNEKGHMKLMDFPVRLFPNPYKSLKNKLMSFMIGSFIDRDFSPEKFQAGAQQAVLHVSRLISDGKFDELSGLVDSKAIPEIKNHYSRLSDEQKKAVALKKEEMTFMFLYEIGMMFNKQKDDGYLEIEVTLVIHVLPPDFSSKALPQSFVGANLTCCNYRFIRAYEKKVPITDWIINKLNHSNSNDQFYSRYK